MRQNCFDGRVRILSRCWGRSFLIAGLLVTASQLVYPAPPLDYQIEIQVLQAIGETSVVGTLDPPWDNRSFDIRLSVGSFRVPYYSKVVVKQNGMCIIEHGSWSWTLAEGQYTWTTLFRQAIMCEGRHWFWAEWLPGKGLFLLAKTVLFCFGMVWLGEYVLRLHRARLGSAMRPKRTKSLTVLTVAVLVWSFLALLAWSRHTLVQLFY